MSFYTNPLIIRARSIARQLGITVVIAKFFRNDIYEKHFDTAMFGSIRKDDVIWDVGANIGYYTKRFVDAVGPRGSVFAFEPFPSTFSRLKAETADLSTVKAIPFALGSISRSAHMQEGGDSIGATNKVVAMPQGDDCTAIEIVSGDILLDRGEVNVPDIIKIDTEGYELDVLQGMTKLLAENRLRALFVEVHFGNLAARGEPDAPAKIEQLLVSSGFRVRWLDLSHLAAYR